MKETVKKNQESIKQLEPKRQSLFVVEFSKEFNISSYLVESVSKPQWSYGNWETMDVTFFDPIGESSSKLLLDIIQRLTEREEDKPLFTFRINLLDPTYEVVETWVIEVDTIDYVSFGDLLKADRGVDISKTMMTIRPLNCTLVK